MTELKERILAAAAKAPSPSRTAMRRRRVLLMPGSAGAMAAIYWMLALHIFGWQGVPRSLILAGGTLLGAASVAAMAVAIAVGRGRDMLGRSRRVRCLWMAMAMGVVPWALLSMTRRAAEPRHPGLLGAAMGVAVGACGWVLIDLWCPVAGTIHLLRGHLLPVVLLGLLGGTVGSVVLRVHSNP